MLLLDLPDARHAVVVYEMQTSRVCEVPHGVQQLTDQHAGLLHPSGLSAAVPGQLTGFNAGQYLGVSRYMPATLFFEFCPLRLLQLKNVLLVPFKMQVDNLEQNVPYSGWCSVVRPFVKRLMK